MVDADAQRSPIFAASSSLRVFSNASLKTDSRKPGSSSEGASRALLLFAATCCGSVPSENVFSEGVFSEEVF